MTTAPVHASARAPRRTLYEMVESKGYLSLGSMEGMSDFGPPVQVEGSRWNIVPGVAIAVVLTIVAYFLHKAPVVPFTIDSETMKHPLGASVLAILLGMGVASVVRLPEVVKVGCKWVASWLIPIAIVFLGARMDISLIASAGPALIGVVLLGMVIAVGLSLALGRMFGLSPSSSYLLGVGTAVCGSSAVLAVAPVSQAKDEDVVLSVGAVNLIGLVAMLGCVGLLWFMPDIAARIYGAWAGATIHAVPQVVAAGASHGAEAATVATVVKLLRVSLLAPVVMLTALWVAKSKLAKRSLAPDSDDAKPKPLLQYVPWFVWGFVGLAILSSLGCLPNLLFENDGQKVLFDTKSGLVQGSKYLLAVAMAAIGLQVNLKSMLRSGGKALFVGTLVWLAMSAVVLAAFWTLL